MTLKLSPFDAADYLKTPEDMRDYLEACMEEGGDDPAFIAQALGVVARAQGMTQVAHQSGLARESLYKALSSEGNPEFATVLKVIQALGLKLHFEVATAS